jgi:hypothetical protein
MRIWGLVECDRIQERKGTLIPQRRGRWMRWEWAFEWGELDYLGFEGELLGRIRGHKGSRDKALGEGKSA